MNNKKVIGILGGMGPEASGYLYDMLMDFAIKYFGAKNNDEFPEVLLYSIPVPDFISSSADKDKAYKMLRNRVKQLNKISLSTLSIACNTAHMLLPDLQKVTRVPFISMIDEVVENIVRDNIASIGILGGPATITTELYQSKLQRHNISVIIPELKHLHSLEEIIRAVIAGNHTLKDVKTLLSIGNILQKRGAKALILGCTELPIIFPKNYSLPIYNSVEILAMALLRHYYEIKTIERR